MEKKQGGDWSFILLLSSQHLPLAGRGEKKKCPTNPKSSRDPASWQKAVKPQRSWGHAAAVVVRGSLVSLHLKSPAVRDDGNFRGNQADRGVTGDPPLQHHKRAEPHKDTRLPASSATALGDLEIRKAILRVSIN